MHKSSHLDHMGEEHTSCTVRSKMEYQNGPILSFDLGKYLLSPFEWFQLTSVPLEIF